MKKRLFPKMKAGAKRAWLAALRSGKYRRAKNQLGDEATGFCCLGVLCHATQIDYMAAHSHLSKRELEKVGLDDNAQIYLAGINDGVWTKDDHEFEREKPYSKPKGYQKNRGASFPAIADWIEKYL